jgi:DNA-binding NtrC family response regulator
MKDCIPISTERRTFCALGVMVMMDADNGASELGSSRALVISASAETRDVLLTTLTGNALVPIFCSSLSEAREHIDRDDVSIVLCDDCLPDRGLEKVVADVDKRHRPVPVIATSKTGEWNEFLKALRTGAFYYLLLPPSHGEVARLLALALRWNLRPLDRLRFRIVA